MVNTNKISLVKRDSSWSYRLLTHHLIDATIQTNTINIIKFIILPYFLLIPTKIGRIFNIKKYNFMFFETLKRNIYIMVMKKLLYLFLLTCVPL